MEPMIQVENLCKSFSTKNGTVEAARNISFSIEKGEIFGIIGLSGAGKSTLVRCLNLLERPTSGTVRVNGKNLTELSEKASKINGLQAVNKLYLQIIGVHFCTPII